PHDAGTPLRGGCRSLRRAVAEGRSRPRIHARCSGTDPGRADCGARCPGRVRGVPAIRGPDAWKDRDPDLTPLLHGPDGGSDPGARGGTGSGGGQPRGAHLLGRKVCRALRATGGRVPMKGEFGRMLPAVVTPPPGPESRRLAAELARFESPNVTFLSESFPVFWAEARGANVRDVDGNVYVDVTAAFAVAAAGHGHPAIVEAVTRQAESLLHGMGDVHPPAVKVELLARLARVAPGDLSRSILANSGAEGVEAALKTVAMATGRPRVLAFRGAYHG